MRSRLGASPMSLASPGSLRNPFSCLAEPHAAASMSWRCVDAASRTYFMRNASPSLFLCLCLTVYTQIQTDMYVHQHIHYRRALRPTARVLYRSCRRRSRIAHTHNAGGQACKYVDKMHARTCDTCGYINKHVYRHVHSHKQAAHSETRFAPLPARMHRPTHLSRKCVRHQSIVSHARLCVEPRLQIVQQCQLHTHDFIKPCRHESILCPRQYRPAGRAPFSCTPPRLLGPHHAHVP